MRGSDGMPEALFTMVNQALGRLNGLFNLIYADTGRASIALEKLLRAMLIQVLFSVRSERQLMAQVRYNRLYRWFIGLAIDDEVWDHSTFSRTSFSDGACRGGSKPRRSSNPSPIVSSLALRHLLSTGDLPQTRREVEHVPLCADRYAPVRPWQGGYRNRAALANGTTLAARSSSTPTRTRNCCGWAIWMFRTSKSGKTTACASPALRGGRRDQG